MDFPSGCCRARSSRLGALARNLKEDWRNVNLTVTFLAFGPILLVATSVIGCRPAGVPCLDRIGHHVLNGW
jgi:hypothetical protein